jgi:hypothetical protein
MNSMLKSRAAVSWCVAYFIVCGVIPVGLLIAEYPFMHAKTYMKVYGHFFLYPLFFGWIPVYLVVCVYPRVKTILPSIVTRTYALWGALFLIAFLAFCIDASSDNVAPWEIKSERLINLQLDDHFTNRLRPNPSASTADIDKERVALENYQTQTNIESGKTTSWSPVRYAYFFSFLGQTLALLLVLVSAVALMVYRIRSERTRSIPKWHKDSLSILSVAAAICILYTFFRLAFSNDKKLFFPEVSNEINSWVVFLLFAGALMCLAACWSLWIGKNIETIIPVGVIGAFLGLYGFKPELIVSQFGKNADFSGYFTILLGVFLCVLIWALFALPPDDPP